MTQNTLTLATVLFGVVVLLIAYIKAKRTPPDIPEEKRYTIDTLFEVVKRELANYVREESIYGVEHEAFNSAWQRQHRFDRALRDCVYGFDDAKLLVKDMIARIIRKELPTETSILSVLDFASPFLDQQVKWEILMYAYKKNYGRNSLSHMIDTYNLAEEKFLIEEKEEPTYAITPEDLDHVYSAEKIPLTYALMVDVLATLLYIRYKGFGCIDTLREMNIDGINGGVSGSVMYQVLGTKNIAKAPRSVWIYYQGKPIHMQFLTFGTAEELRRICTLLGRLRKPGPLTERKPVQITTMYDESRVLIIRPSAGEYWAFFIRKFTLSDKRLTTLWNPMVEVPDEEEVSVGVSAPVQECGDSDNSAGVCDEGQD